MSPDWKKLGARSRSRGYRYEKYVAELLGWSRVAFSGANAAFGEGDVIDGFVNGAGYWLAECKMRTGKESGNVNIDGKWVRQADDACERSGRFPVIIIGTKTDHRRPQGIVLVGEESTRFLRDRISHATNRRQFSWIFESARRWHSKTANRSGGFTVKASFLNTEWQSAHLTIDAGGELSEWFVLRLEHFVELMRNLENACVPGPFFYDDDD